MHPARAGLAASAPHWVLPRGRYLSADQCLFPRSLAGCGGAALWNRKLTAQLCVGACKRRHRLLQIFSGLQDISAGPCCRGVVLGTLQD